MLDCGCTDQEQHSLVARSTVYPARGQLLGTQILTLCERREFTTLGSGSTTYLPFGNELRDVGMALDEIRIVARVENISSVNFTFNVKGQWSYEGITWSDFGSLLLSGQSAGQVIGSVYTTRTDFGPRIRFLLGVADTGTKEVATVSARAELRFHC